MSEILIGGIITLAGVALGSLIRFYSDKSVTKTHQQHEERLAALDRRQREIEAQEEHRARLREVYIDLVRAARRSRESSLSLAITKGSTDASEEVEGLTMTATVAHDQFVEEYHLLYLIADHDIYERLRELRSVLDEMLKAAKIGDRKLCEEDVKHARHARQNLAGAFRIALGEKPLQPHKSLPDRFRVLAA